MAIFVHPKPSWIAASIATRNAANLLATYREDAETGGNRFVTILKVAKTAGDVAQVVLTVADGAAFQCAGRHPSPKNVYVGLKAGDAVVISVTSKGITAERFVSEYASSHPAFAADLGKVALAPEARSTGSAAIQGAEQKAVNASARDLTQIGARDVAGAGQVEEVLTDVEKYVKDHPPGPIEGKIPGHRSRPLGEHHEHDVVEVTDPTTSEIECEIHSRKPYPRIPCSEVGLGPGDEIAPRLLQAADPPKAPLLVGDKPFTPVTQAQYLKMSSADRDALIKEWMKEHNVERIIESNESPFTPGRNILGTRKTVLLFPLKSNCTAHITAVLIKSLTADLEPSITESSLKLKKLKTFAY